MASAASIGAVPGIGHAQDPPCEQGGVGRGKLGWWELAGPLGPGGQGERLAFIFYLLSSILFKTFLFIFNFKLF